MVGCFFLSACNLFFLHGPFDARFCCLCAARLPGVVFTLPTALVLSICTKYPNAFTEFECFQRRTPSLTLRNPRFLALGGSGRERDSHALGFIRFFSSLQNGYYLVKLLAALLVTAEPTFSRKGNHILPLEWLAHTHLVRPFTRHANHKQLYRH